MLALQLYVNQLTLTTKVICPQSVAAVEISDRKDLNTLYKFRNLISVNRVFIKDYKVTVSI
jgi:hypothetical protein